MLQLVQLSDLHIGGAYFKQKIFDTIVNEVNNRLKPDVIVITGDLTDEGLSFQFKRASAEIRRLTDVCPNVIVLPGNHDYRHTGYLLFKKFFPFRPSNAYEFNKTLIITLATARPDRDEGEWFIRKPIGIEVLVSKVKSRLNY